jgi:hypothetical protein
MLRLLDDVVEGREAREAEPAVGAEGENCEAVSVLQNGTYLQDRQKNMSLLIIPSKHSTLKRSRLYPEDRLSTKQDHEPIYPCGGGF